MQYRVDEKTGNQISVLGFGCMRLPRNRSGVDYPKAEQIILRAIEAGVNYFDVAYIYPDSEATLGKVLANNQMRERVYIATKLPIALCQKAEDFDYFFTKQLKSLQTDYIDYYLMHNIGTVKEWEKLKSLGIEDWIQRKQSDGGIRRIGFSFHGALEAFQTIISAYDWDFCQIQYNYSNEHFQAGVSGLRLAAEKKMPVIIMEPLLGGKLVTNLPARAEQVFHQTNPKLTKAAWGLRWLLNQPEVTVILSGMNSEDQLEDNLKTADSLAPGQLSADEADAYAQVSTIFQEAFKVPCTACGYCMPCPQNVNIPGCFAAYNASYAMGMFTGFHQYGTSTGLLQNDDQTAGKCIGCKKCESHCPQKIQISNKLRMVKRRLEPFYFRPLVALLRHRLMRISNRN